MNAHVLLYASVVLCWLSEATGTWGQIRGRRGGRSSEAGEGGARHQKRQAAGSGGRVFGDDKPPGDTPPQSQFLEAKGVASALPPDHVPLAELLRPIGLAIRVLAAERGVWARLPGVWARLPMFRLSG